MVAFRVIVVDVIVVSKNLIKIPQKIPNKGYSAKRVISMNNKLDEDFIVTICKGCKGIFDVTLGNALEDEYHCERCNGEMKQGVNDDISG